MTKEMIQERLDKMEKLMALQNEKINQAVADLNAMNGSKQELLYWLAKLDEPKAEMI